MSSEAGTQVVWEELDFGHVQPVRTAFLATQDDSSFHLIRHKPVRSLRLWANVASAFLPEGYPESVTTDYLSFQLWDTLQGLSTYVRSMLSTQALLSGIGVGQTTATVMGATFQWFLRDFTGMLGGIVFTIIQGSNLDSKAKHWRLAADFMNDIGMLLDLVSPLFPKLFVTLLCIGSIARSVTGVASGATRAALTQHFALQQNAADISAKEGSQETAATLTGMLFGMLLAKLIGSHPGALWICFLALTSFHMFANYKAVRSLCLTSLNKERTKILLDTFLNDQKVLSPADVSTKENILPLLPISKGISFTPIKRTTIILGAKISSVDLPGGWELFPKLLQRYSRDHYFLVLEKGRICVVLHKHATREDILKAYVHALVVARNLETCATGDAELGGSLWMEKNYSEFLVKLKASGWNIDKILVHPGSWRAVWSTLSTAKSD